MSRETSRQIVALLSEILPADKFMVRDSPAMGFDGVMVLHHETGGDFYFDTTFGGDDGFTDYVRFYYTFSDGECLDDQAVHDNPLLSDSPLKIAKWIVLCVGDGQPPQ